MFDRLFDFLFSILDLFFFVEIVDDYQGAVVLRLGRYHRTLEPGAHLYWPFKLERVIPVSVVPDNAPLDEQRFTLADGSTVIVRPTVTYTVKDVRKFILDVRDAVTSFTDSVPGVVRREFARHAWADFTDPEKFAEIEKDALREMRKEARRWGVEIERAQYPDIVRLDSAFGLFGSRGME